MAQKLGVSEATITNWETNGAQPTLKHTPGDYSLPGLKPDATPSPGGVGERLCRTDLGITQSELARQLDVDACTLARWERGEREPTGAFAKAGGHCAS